MNPFYQLCLLSRPLAFFLLFFPVTLFVNGSPQAAPLPETRTSEDIVEQLQEFYRSVTSLSFTFIQTTQGQMVGRPKTGKGNGLFARTENGDKMRWNYHTPDRQVLISDEEIISMYFEELNQMIITPVSQSQADVLFSFFSGRKNLDDSFTIMDMIETAVTNTSSDDGEVQAVTLIPTNPDSQIAMIRLFISADNLIRRIELIDHFETATTITIADIAINPFISKQGEEIEQLFYFSPPEGTEIINQSL